MQILSSAVRRFICCGATRAAPAEGEQLTNTDEPGPDILHAAGAEKTRHTGGNAIVRDAIIDEPREVDHCSFVRFLLEYGVPALGFALCTVGMLGAAGVIAFNLPWLAPTMIVTGMTVLFVYLFCCVTCKTGATLARVRSIRVPSILEHGAAQQSAAVVAADQSGILVEAN